MKNYRDPKEIEKIKPLLTKKQIKKMLSSADAMIVYANEITEYAYSIKNILVEDSKKN